jgi:hypothetical protein
MSLIIIRVKNYTNIQSLRFALLINKFVSPHTYITCAILLFISATLNSPVQTKTPGGPIKLREVGRG